MTKPEGAEFNSKAWSLGFGPALALAFGYPGELVVAEDFTPCWICWFVPMTSFGYMVYERMSGLSGTTSYEPDLEIKRKIQTAQIMTATSWYAYTSKCGVASVTYQITYAQSEKSGRWFEDVEGEPDAALNDSCRRNLGR